MSISSSSRRAFLHRAAGLLAAPAVLTACASEPPEAPAAPPPAPSAAPSAAPAPPPFDESGFVSIFDGASLDGWHTNPEEIGHGTGGDWRVENGAVVGAQDPPGSGNGGILLSDATFGDFELLFDLRPDWGIDSGLFLRSTEQGAGLQIMHDYLEGGIVGVIYGEQLGGFSSRAFSLTGTTGPDGALTALDTTPNESYDERPLAYHCTAEDYLAAWRIDDWNTFRIRCEGRYPTIFVWINGTHVCTFDGATYEHPRYDRDAVLDTLGAEGHVALQVHGGAARWPADAVNRWRNIRVKALG